MSATDVVGILVTTFILGSIYGLVAIGMTLIYGALLILEMSQGSMVMIGSFVGWGVLVVAGWNPLVAILLAFAATFLHCWSSPNAARSPHTRWPLPPRSRSRGRTSSSAARPPSRLSVAT